MIEIRNDEIADALAKATWAERLGALFRASNRRSVGAINRQPAV